MYTKKNKLFRNPRYRISYDIIYHIISIVCKAPALDRLVNLIIALSHVAHHIRLTVLIPLFNLINYNIFTPLLSTQYYCYVSRATYRLQPQHNKCNACAINVDHELRNASIQAMHMNVHNFLHGVPCRLKRVSSSQVPNSNPSDRWAVHQKRNISLYINTLEMIAYIDTGFSESPHGPYSVASHVFR